MANGNGAKVFVVKKVKPARKEGDKPFYMEVGRLLMRETEKGVSGTLYLHLLDGDFVFLAEKREEWRAGARCKPKGSRHAGVP